MSKNRETDLRFNALDLAVRAYGDRAASQIVKSAESFYQFLATKDEAAQQK